MSNITKENMQIFRQYFLSHNDEVRRNMRNMMPGMLLKYLSILEDGFMRNASIENTAVNIEAYHLIPELQQLQFDYYSSLANIYSDGKTNPEIEQLLLNDNQLFKKVLFNYQDQIFEKEIKQAFILNERESLKRKFQSIQKESEISSQEIENAFKLIERKKLKKQFQELEHEAKANFGQLAISNAKYSYVRTNEKPTASASLILFNWQRIAIAASIVGLLLTAGYFVTKENYSKQSQIASVNETSDTSSRNNITNQLYSKPISETEGNVKAFAVKKEKPTINEKVDSIYVNLRDIHSLTQLEMIKESYSNSDSITESGVHSIDSFNSIKKYLASIENTYTFDRDIRRITLNVLNVDTVSAVYQLLADSKTQTYYIDLKSSFYQINPNNNPTKLRSIKNKYIIKKLNGIH